MYIYLYVIYIKRWGPFHTSATPVFQRTVASPSFQGVEKIEKMFFCGKFGFVHFSKSVNGRSAFSVNKRTVESKGDPARTRARPVSTLGFLQGEGRGKCLFPVLYPFTGSPPPSRYLALSPGGRRDTTLSWRQHRWWQTRPFA